MKSTLETGESFAITFGGPFLQHFKIKEARAKAIQVIGDNSKFPLWIPKSALVKKDDCGIYEVKKWFVSGLDKPWKRVAIGISGY